jgi:hypothetical protein
MIDPFITFVIHAESLDDPQLSLTVKSIRQQTDMCWSLEVKVVEMPDILDIASFTHDNPRVTVSEQYSHSNGDFRSTAMTVLPRGLELLPDACTEIKKAFADTQLDIVVAPTIFTPRERPQFHEDSTQFFQSLICLRMQPGSDLSPLIGEIRTPIGIMCGDIPSQPFDIRDVHFSGTRDSEIRSTHLAQLESQILILKLQLQHQKQITQSVSDLSQNLIVARRRVAALETELMALRKSRTWKVGRLLMFPIWGLKSVRKRFKNRN